MCLLQGLALWNDKVWAMVSTGIEARGFIFGPPIALAIGAKFVPMRKPRKLPGILCFH
jgi:adenine/guanine phosphoribosyltransferase-like PRPP-binding protein